MKKASIKIVLIIASLLGNIILINEILKVNQIDKNATENNLMMYMHHFELMTLHMGEVLKDFDNKESAYYVTSEAEFLRVFSTVPMDNYYGQKKMDLSKHIIGLANQVNKVVSEYFLFQNVASLSTTEQAKLQEMQSNFQGIIEKVNKIGLELIEQKVHLIAYENELVELINEAVEKNEKILVSME